jgi:hypothetical protein
MVCLPKQKLFVLLALLVLASYSAAAAQQQNGSQPKTAHAGHSLNELRNKRRVLLLVFRSRVIDVSENRERAIIEDVLKADPQPKGRFRWVYNAMARKLNKYMNKYRSLTAADGLADAEYVIYFNVVEFRRILDTVYPYGELFVIVKGEPEQLKPPRIVWRGRKVMFADDVLDDLIKDLKSVRGES